MVQRTIETTPGYGSNLYQNRFRRKQIHMDAFYKGMKPELLNNLYALLYQKAAYEITKEVTGDGIVWARSAWAGCQRYPFALGRRFL
mgnify:CR=1 FL=1